jgi:hypothetical protein
VSDDARLPVAIGLSIGCGILLAPIVYEQVVKVGMTREEKRNTTMLVAGTLGVIALYKLAGIQKQWLQFVNLEAPQIIETLGP